MFGGLLLLEGGLRRFFFCMVSMLKDLGRF